jgi:23S rRNA G2445 N2-methylase RlmL
VLKKELKGQIRKHALAMVDQFRTNPETHYNLHYRQRVKKFFALSFRKVDGEEQKVDKRAPKILP